MAVQVYDGTGFLKDHPGGAESILLAAGMDSSDDFNAIHSAKAKKMVDEYYIGEFDENAPSKLGLLCMHTRQGDGSQEEVQCRSSHSCCSWKAILHVYCMTQT